MVLNLEAFRLLGCRDIKLLVSNFSAVLVYNTGNLHKGRDRHPKFGVCNSSSLSDFQVPGSFEEYKVLTTEAGSYLTGMIWCLNIFEIGNSSDALTSKFGSCLETERGGPKFVIRNFSNDSILQCEDHLKACFR